MLEFAILVFVRTLLLTTLATVYGWFVTRKDLNQRPFLRVFWKTFLLCLGISLASAVIFTLLLGEGRTLSQFLTLLFCGFYAKKWFTASEPPPLPGTPLSSAPTLQKPGVFALLKRPFDSYETKAVRAEAHALIRKHANQASDLLSKRCDAHINQSADVIKQTIRLEHKTASSCAAFLVLNQAADLLLTGQHHIYRGVLSTTGHDLQRTHGALARHLVAINAMTEAEAAEEISTVQDEIAHVG